MENIVTSIFFLGVWFISILFPIFITSNEKYIQQKKESSISKKRVDTHFLKQ
tara:strand:- start:7577 stop:7732 length:156 start_codon:yes stop_codon:yes gene_type:complete